MVSENFPPKVSQSFTWHSQVTDNRNTSYMKNKRYVLSWGSLRVIIKVLNKDASNSYIQLCYIYWATFTNLTASSYPNVTFNAKYLVIDFSVDISHIDQVYFSPINELQSTQDRFLASASYLVLSYFLKLVS